MLIHYCDACSVRIPSGALESGNAVRAGEKIFCPACAPKTAPARPSAVIPRAAALHPKEATATRLHERPATARRPQGATEPAITPPPSKKYIWVGVVLGGAGLLLALLALNQGAPPEKPAKAASAATATRKSSGSPTAAQPASATPVTRGTPEQTVPQPPLHRPLSEEQQAQQAFEKLFHGLEAQDKDGRITRLKEFVEQYGKTIIVARALNELDRLKRTDPTTPAISSTQSAPATTAATIPLATPPVAPEVVPPVAPPAGVRFKGVWQELKPAAPTPGPRSHHQTMLCYDSKRGRCVLGGGDRKNDLWALDAATASWTCLVPNEPKAPATRPGGLAHDSLVYEEAQDRYFLGAGWTYDPEGGKWNCLFGKPDSPIKTALFNIGRAFAYDPDGKCFLSVSKLNKGREKGLLVYLDPPRLEEVPLAPIPPRDYLYGGLAYDRKHKHFVLFGGYLYSGASALNDTWHIDSGKQSVLQAQSSGSPPAKRASALHWDGKLEVLVLLDALGDASAKNEAWVYETGAQRWTPVVSAGQIPGKTGASCYDAKNDWFVFYDSAGRTYTLKIEVQP